MAKRKRNLKVVRPLRTTTKGLRFKDNVTQKMVDAARKAMDKASKAGSAGREAALTKFAQLLKPEAEANKAMLARLRQSVKEARLAQSTAVLKARDAAVPGERVAAPEGQKAAIGQTQAERATKSRKSRAKRRGKEKVSSFEAGRKARGGVKTAGGGVFTDTAEAREIQKASKVAGAPKAAAEPTVPPPKGGGKGKGTKTPRKVRQSGRGVSPPKQPGTVTSPRPTKAPGTADLLKELKLQKAKTAKALAQFNAEAGAVAAAKVGGTQTKPPAKPRKIAAAPATPTDAVRPVSGQAKAPKGGGAEFAKRRKGAPRQRTVGGQFGAKGGPAIPKAAVPQPQAFRPPTAAGVVGPRAAPVPGGPLQVPRAGALVARRAIVRQGRFLTARRSLAIGRRPLTTTRGPGVISGGGPATKRVENVAAARQRAAARRLARIPKAPAAAGGVGAAAAKGLSLGGKFLKGLGVVGIAFTALQVLGAIQKRAVQDPANVRRELAGVGLRLQGSIFDDLALGQVRRASEGLERQVVRRQAEEQVSNLEGISARDELRELMGEEALRVGALSRDMGNPTFTEALANSRRMVGRR